MIEKSNWPTLNWTPGTAGRIATTALVMAGLFATGGMKLAYAQSTTGDIVGTVTDASGAIVPNATVTLTDLGTKTIRTAQTGEAGDYTFTLLGPGNYSIVVTDKGFKKFEIANIALAASDRAREDAKLEIGSEGETVQVTGQAPALQTDSSVLSNTVTEKAVQDLPLNGRNYINLVQITPGVNEGPPNGLSSGGRPDDRRFTSSVSVNGQSDVINDEMVDGMDNNERIIGTIGVRPSIEAIREINVQTNAFTAEVGRTAGGVINVITKAGSNQFHGSAFEFFRNDVLDANPYQFGGTNPKPKLRQNQFGGSIGGPIIRNKSFFFGDYEGFRSITGQNPSTVQVPTVAQYNLIHTNPTALTNGAPIDKVGLAYAMLYPLPNAAPTVFDAAGNAVSAPFVASPVIVRNSDTADGRVDYNFNEHNLFFARYTYNNVPSSFPGLLPAVSVGGVSIQPGGAIYNFYGAAKDIAQGIQLNYVHTFTSNVLLELKAGYTRINNQSFPLNYGTNVNQAFGQPNVNIDQSTSGLAPVGVSGYADLGDGSYIPIVDIDNTYQYMGAVTWNKGAHSMKMGAALIRRQALNLQNNQGMGNWQFNALNGQDTALSGLLTGVYNNVQRSNSLVPPNYRMWEPSVYFQDDWHASSNLTLNLGIRYDVFTPFTDKNGAISNFNPATASIDVANVNGVNSYAGLQTTWTNVAPRIGFAFSARPDLVLRGGFGISYVPENYTSNASLKNQPFVSSYSCNFSACPAQYQSFAAGEPLPTAASATSPSGQIADVVDPAFRTSYLEQYNLTVEKDFAGNVLTASYVGMLGRHLAQIYNDQNTPGAVSNSQLEAIAASQSAPFQQVSTGTAFNTLRPFYKQLPNVTSIGGYNSRGASNYNAVTVSFTRRTKAGLTLGANYTWAHGLDNVLGLSNEINDGYGAIPSQISSLEYGNSDVDIRNRVVFTGNYELPFGKNLKGVSGALGKGWQLNTLLVWESGEPFTISNSQDVFNTSNGATSGRPNQVKNAKLSNPRVGEFFDASAFQPQASGTLGSERRNPLYGPHYRHVDASVFKTFPVYRETTLEFRVEAFNVINTTNFSNPQATLQVAPVANANGTPSDNYVSQSNTIGQITTTSPNYNPRLIQFALKYQF